MMFYLTVAEDPRLGRDVQASIDRDQRLDVDRSKRREDSYFRCGNVVLAMVMLPGRLRFKGQVLPDGISNRCKSLVLAFDTQDLVLNAPVYPLFEGFCVPAKIMCWRKDIPGKNHSKSHTYKKSNHSKIHNSY